MGTEPGKVDLDRALTLRRLLAAGAVAAMVALAPPSVAQVAPGVDTSPTSAPASTTSTTAPPSGDHFEGGSSTAPEGAEDPGGDGAAAPEGGITVPPEAQQIINSVRRTRANSNSRLLAMLPQLTALGISEAEAHRIGLGRFPIAGPAHYSHDWLYPRYGPGFRFHLGTDVFAAFGTPVRAPVDGVARTAMDSLGGLTVKVVMPDGTYFYLAHLSGLVEGFVDGMPVATGDIVGYVGDSGNARGGSPHVHLGVYPRGGAPVDPKPILDHFLAEAEARIPELVQALEAARPLPTDDERQSASEVQRRLRPMLATELLHPLASGGGTVPAELLYLVGANPVDGPRALVDLAVTDLIGDIDWSTR